MKHTSQIAKHLRELFFGGNWTWSNFKQHAEHIDWKLATTKLHSCNSIAVLLHHVTYYVHIQIKVLSGGPLEGKDALSFTHPPIHNQEDWEQMQATTWQAVEQLVALIEAMPDEQLFDHFSVEKYGNYYRNLLGLIEHSHYHLGQMVLIKKILQQDMPQ